ncbi:MAG: AMP-binding protein [Actinomycetota bacterium]|nr:AMP-binding protein [Actinomycetota bacterium]
MTHQQGFVEQLIRQRAGAHPEEPWLFFRDETYTWGEVLEACRRVANGFLELGVRPGQRIALMMGNRPEFLWAHFAAGFIGASTVPVNVSQRGPTLAHVLADSGATAAVADVELLEVLDAARGAGSSLRYSVAVGDLAAKRAGSAGSAGKPGGGSAGKPGGGSGHAGRFDWSFDRLLSAPDRDPETDIEDPGTGVAMLYTSGTTGPPKGVVSTGAAGTAALVAVLGALQVKAGETMYTPLPLFHGNALLVSTLGSMVLDARLALGERFKAAGFFDECRRYGAVEFNTLGGMISLLLKEPPRKDDREHQVRVVLSAGCPPDRWESFQERFGVRLVEWYALVDAPGVLLNDVGRVGSMGRPVGDSEFRVVDAEDHPLPAGEVGELVFRHPAGQLSHYHNRPDDTDEAWRGGWFHTGDLAVVSEDGFFTYRGRKKESIRRLGENISAWEIETVVAEHPAILECAAHAVASELGEDEVKLCVVLRPGSVLDPAEVVAFCQGKVARYALPRFVEVLDELPKTPSQRVRYGDLRARGVTPGTWDRRLAELREKGEKAARAAAAGSWGGESLPEKSESLPGKDAPAGRPPEALVADGRRADA